MMRVIDAYLIGRVPEALRRHAVDSARTAVGSYSREGSRHRSGGIIVTGNDLKGIRRET
jgi:hypothetical protein